MTTQDDKTLTADGRERGALQAAASIGAAIGAAASACAAGNLDLGRALGGFGREIVRDTGEHLRAAVRARSLRELAELQAAFAQHRIEMSTTYAKEFADLARSASEQAIAPIAGLLKANSAG